MVISDGPHTTEVLNVLRNEIRNSESLESIRERAAQVLEQSVNPIEKHRSIQVMVCCMD